MTFLIADGVVPSNEDRGYVLRRIMRRAIQQGRSLELEPGFLARYADVVTELMGAEYPELHEQRESVHKWLELPRRRASAGRSSRAAGCSTS